MPEEVRCLAPSGFCEVIAEVCGVGKGAYYLGTTRMLQPSPEPAPAPAPEPSPSPEPEPKPEREPGTTRMFFRMGAAAFLEELQAAARTLTPTLTPTRTLGRGRRSP